MCRSKSIQPVHKRAAGAFDCLSAAKAIERPSATSRIVSPLTNASAAKSSDPDRRKDAGALDRVVDGAAKRIAVVRRLGTSAGRALVATRGELERSPLGRVPIASVNGTNSEESPALGDYARCDLTRAGNASILFVRRFSHSRRHVARFCSSTGLQRRPSGSAPPTTFLLLLA